MKSKDNEFTNNNSPVSNRYKNSLVENENIKFFTPSGADNEKEKSLTSFCLDRRFTDSTIQDYEILTQSNKATPNRDKENKLKTINENNSSSEEEKSNHTTLSLKNLSEGAKNLGDGALNFGYNVYSVGKMITKDAGKIIKILKDKALQKGDSKYNFER